MLSVDLQTLAIVHCFIFIFSDIVNVIVCDAVIRACTSS